MKIARTLAVLAFATWVGTVHAQVPQCAAGYIYVGGHELLRFDLPPIWIGGRCMKIQGTTPGFTPVGPAPVYPSYYLITILYAVPGELSEAQYGAGASVGSKTEDSKSFKTGIQAEVETNVFDLTAGYSSTTKDGHSFEVKKTSSSTLTVDGVADPQNRIDHGKDVFFLWVNPEIDLTQVSQTQVTQKLAPRSGQSMTVVSVTAAELNDPSLMPAWKQTALAAVTASDRSHLLSLDPFFASQAIGGSTRFVKIDTLQLEGPDRVGDPVTGEGLQVDSEQTTGTSHENDKDVSVTLLVGGEVSLGIVSKVMVGGTFDWTWETTSENTTGSVQSYEVMLKTALIGFHSVIDVYQDTLFNSLAFVQVGPPVSETQARIYGTVVDSIGRPVPHELITISLSSGAVRRVLTNANGVYRVFDLPNEKVNVGLRGEERSVLVASTAQKLDFKVASVLPRR